MNMRQTRMLNPLTPSAAVLCKLGSIIVHIEEGLSSKGHHFDMIALTQLIQDEEVSQWLAAMDQLAFIPKKR